jgi:uncharacterized UPF0160 family protein
VTASLPRLLTHSGKFHCDDAFAYATLRFALRLTTSGVDHVLIRTRDRAEIDAADIVWDVGTKHDPAAQRFDHHQRGAPVRPETEVPFSAAGLVWQVHGVNAVRAILPPDAAAFAEAIAAKIDRDVIRRIDAIDNGVAHPEDSLGLSSIVDDCNLPWDSPEAGNPDAETRAFVAAADLMAGFLRNRVERVRGKLAADAIILAAHQASADPRILELDRRMPWQSACFAHALPVLYAVYPVPAGNWMVDAMPAEKGSFSQRLPLPAAWAGLEAEALAAATGVPDAVFVHTARFVGAARSRAGAMRMAQAAIAIGAAAAPAETAAPADALG